MRTNVILLMFTVMGSTYVFGLLGGTHDFAHVKSGSLNNAPDKSVSMHDCASIFGRNGSAEYLVRPSTAFAQSCYYEFPVQSRSAHGRVRVNSRSIYDASDKSVSMHDCTSIFGRNGSAEYLVRPSTAFAQSCYYEFPVQSRSVYDFARVKSVSMHDCTSSFPGNGSAEYLVQPSTAYPPAFPQSCHSEFSVKSGIMHDFARVQSGSVYDFARVLPSNPNSQSRSVHTYLPGEPTKKNKVPYEN